MTTHDRLIRFDGEFVLPALVTPAQLRAVLEVYAEHDHSDTIEVTNNGVQQTTFAIFEHGEDFGEPAHVLVLNKEGERVEEPVAA